VTLRRLRDPGRTGPAAIASSDNALFEPRRRELATHSTGGLLQIACGTSHNSGACHCRFARDDRHRSNAIVDRQRALLTVVTNTTNVESRRRVFTHAICVLTPRTRARPIAALKRLDRERAYFLTPLRADLLLELAELTTDLVMRLAPPGLLRARYSARSLGSSDSTPSRLSRSSFCRPQLAVLFIEVRSGDNLSPAPGAASVAGSNRADAWNLRLREDDRRLISHAAIAHPHQNRHAAVQQQRSLALNDENGRGL